MIFEPSLRSTFSRGMVFLRELGVLSIDVSCSLVLSAPISELFNPPKA